MIVRKSQFWAIGHRSPTFVHLIWEVISHPSCHGVFITLGPDDTGGSNYARIGLLRDQDPWEPFEKLPTTQGNSKAPPKQ